MANGFYGSLSKIQKINFQFDRVFPNRAAMDQEADLGYYIAEGGREKLDPVLVGRYVLVDYHEGDIVDKTVRIGYNVNGDIMAAPGISFGDGDGEVPINNDDRITVIGSYDANDNYTPYNVPKVYKYPFLTTPINYTSNNNNADSYSTYERNLIIDGEQYINIGRGWDSTVWQKTYQGGKAKYIMIAELNAFNPTIALAPEPPHRIPLSPYIGDDSTLDFYRIHMETPAGIRIKRAELLQESIHTPRNTYTDWDHSQDVTTYPSDVTGDYPTVNDVYSNQPLAIYYNKKGFNKFVSASNALEALGIPNSSDYANYPIRNGLKYESKDFIGFTLSGRSGKFYSAQASKPEVDMYELSIMLPSIGETISKIYDLVYGKNRYYNTDGLHLYYKDPSLVSTDTVDYTTAYFANEDAGIGFRNVDTYWNSYQGIRSYKKDGTNEKFDSAGLSTLAGVINSAHDLMGMIVRDYDELIISDDAVKRWDPTKIYFKDNKYYIKNKTYDWNPYSPNQISSNVYSPVYFLPQTIQKQNGELSDDIDPDKAYFIDVRDNLYRESWEEYPVITDEEVYDSGKNSLFGKQYINYIKVKNESDLIEGATYGIIQQVSPEDDEVIVDFDSNHEYYFYDTTVKQLRGVYRLRSDDPNSGPSYDGEKNKGIYYDLSLISNLEDIRQQTTFYIPNIYYIKNNDTGVTVKATFGSLQEFLGKKSYSSVNDTQYSFYTEVKIGQGTLIEEDTSSFDLKYNNVPDDVNRYSYDNGVLTIYNDSTHSAVIDTITFEIEDGFGTIEFEDLEYQIPVGYRTKQYTNSEKKVYYTKDEIFMSGLDPNEYNIPKYGSKPNTGAGTVDVLIPDDNTRLLELVDFEEEKYFYRRSETDIIMEDLTHLMQKSGQERNKNHQYYAIDWQSIKIVLNNAGGNYYKTADGDYKLYPCLHGEDPTQNINPALAGETRLPVQPLFIPITKIENTRIFRPDTYYINSAGTGKAAALPTETSPTAYYERIGNIVGNSEPMWPDGMEWNEETLSNGVQLGSRTIKWEAKEINGMAKDFNTMHGLILKVYQLLQSDDKNTRDPYTVQGILNKCRDVLISLENMGYSFHSVTLKNKNGENQLIEATSPSASINLISDTNSIELSEKDGAVSIDLAEKYRDWVVPNKDGNETSLTFNNQGKISLDNNTFKLSSTIKRISKEFVLTPNSSAWKCSTASESIYVPVYIVLNGNNNKPAYLTVGESDGYNSLQENDKLNFYFYNDYEQTKLLGELKNVLVTKDGTVLVYDGTCIDPWVASSIIKAIKLEVIRNNSIYATGVAFNDNAANAENSFNSYTLDELEISNSVNEYLTANNSSFKYKDNSVVTSISDPMTMEWKASENTFYINVNGTPLLRIVKSED